MAQNREFTENVGLLHSKKKLIMKAAALRTTTSMTSFQTPQSQLGHSRKLLNFILKENSELCSHLLPTHITLSTSVAFVKQGLLFSLPSYSMRVKPKVPSTPKRKLW